MEMQHRLAFQRHGKTNHFVARSWDQLQQQGEKDGATTATKRRGRPRRRAGAEEAAAAAGKKGSGRAGGSSFWVASFDAFVDCQLRAHESMKEPLRTRGANFEWKVR